MCKERTNHHFTFLLRGVIRWQMPGTMRFPRPQERFLNREATGQTPVKHNTVPNELVIILHKKQAEKYHSEVLDVIIL